MPTVEAKIALRAESARRFGGADVVVAIAIAITAVAIAKTYLPRYRAAGGVPLFYQEQFGPAVMQVCRQQFTNPDARTVPALAAFLERKTDRLSCADLPPVVRKMPREPFQDGHRYLLGAAAAVWRVTGISWTALDWRGATLFAVSLSAAYAALRFVCGRAWAGFVTLLWAVSPLHLENLPHLRDYSKAPFFILMLVALLLVSTARRSATLIAIGALFGAVEGLGFGMRTDVVLNVAPFLLVVFAGGRDPVRRKLPAKIACATASLVMFVVVALPALKPYQTGSKLWHVTLLGLSTPFDPHLKIRPAAYDFGHEYLDGYIESVVTTWWSRTHPAAGPVNFASPSYDAVCRSYYATLFETFPGDFVTRMLGSAVHVFELPFRIVSDRTFGATAAPILWAARKRGALVDLFYGTGVIAALGALILIGTDNLRYAAVGFILLFGWATYPFLQFEGRHVFHLEFVVLGIIAAALSLAWTKIRDAQRTGMLTDLSRRAARSVLVVAALSTAVVAALFVARTVQRNRAPRLIARYDAAPIAPLPQRIEPLAGTRVRVAVDPFQPFSATYGAEEVMLVAEFRGGACARHSIDATFAYEHAAGVAGLDFTRELTVAAGPSVASRVFFPAYALRRSDRPASRFVGVDLAADSAACLQLSRVLDLGDAPFLNAIVTRGGPPPVLEQRLDVSSTLPPWIWGSLVRIWPRIGAVG